MNEEQERRIKNALIYGTSHPEMYKTELDVCKETIERQAAQIEMMRGALTIVMRHVALGLPTAVCTQANNALLAAATIPDQALKQFADRVREQCARVCENPATGPSWYECAAAIRAIKGLPPAN